MLKAALIGFGGIAKAHQSGYANLENDGKVKLVAVCDVCEDAFEKKIKINIDSDTNQDVSFRCYTDLEEMLANEDLDFVDICVPSYLHKELSVKLLERGYNVLCEKPMALNSRDCEDMLEAERRYEKHFMIAQCLRFFPEYEYLKNCIDDGRFGKVLGAFFNRNSAQPLWGYQNWYTDYERCGGAIMDIHIHDIDMARYLFGEPNAVSCRSSDCKTKYDIVQTSLYYTDMPVSANGCWTAGRIKFAASYKVDFEKATVIYENGVVTVYTDNPEAEPYKPELVGYDGYTEEISFFCDIVEGKTKNTRNPAFSAAKTIRLIEAMKLSVDNNGEKIILGDKNEY